MLSTASVGSAAGAATYFAKDNYYTVAESSEISEWSGEGAEALGLTDKEKPQEGKESSLGVEDDKAEADGPPAEAGAPGVPGKDEVEAPSEPGASPDGAAPGATDDKAVPTTDAGHNVVAPAPIGVTKDDFEAILNGKLPDGTQVGEPGKRQIGMDLTFNMPKSASVLAYVAGDKRILAAHMQSVKTTMSWVEKNLAEGRIKKDGMDVPIRTGNLVYALFQHDTSRDLDPQGHIHAVIANMTRMPDGSWKALHNGQIWRNNTVIGAVYHAQFRAALEKLGYGIETGGKHGSFEIKGVPKDVVTEFSKRQQQMDATASRLGVTSHAGRDAIATTTRDKKITVADRAALAESWKDRAAEKNFDGRALVDEAIARAAPASTPLERGREAVGQAIIQAQRVLGNLLRPHDPLVDSGLARLTQTPATARTQMAVASAVRILSQREAAYEVHNLSRTALNLGLKDVTIDRVEARITQLIAKGEIVPGATTREDRVVTHVTTREALATEMGILAEVDRGKGRVRPLIDAATAATRLQTDERTLNAGQLAAGTLVLSSRDRIVNVQGIAGAGKSTMLGAVANVLRSENKPVLGLAFQNKMVADLSAGAGIEAKTVASFIMSNERYLERPSGPGFEAARERLAGSYLVLDEASMVSNDQTHMLARIANLMKVEKLVLVGDRQQLSSIDAGKSFALMQETGTKTERMTENLRQRTPELKAVAALANLGRAGEAIRTLGDAVSESPARADHAAGMWLKLSPDERERTGLFASGRETRAAITDVVQQGLRDEGTLKGEGMTLTVLDRVNTTREELRYAKTYEPGRTIDLRSQIDAIGLKRGQYDVLRVFGNGMVEVKSGRQRIKFDPQRIDPMEREDRIALAQKKNITIFEGDRIRWTAKDKDRELQNNDVARVVGVDKQGVTIERADKTVLTLGAGDPMLARMDLAYALNMHMAQGVTIDRGIGVMGSEERYLSNQRLFNVMVTRVRDGIDIVTDDKDKLIRQIERTTGDKTSALETIGEARVDRGKGRDDPFDPGSIGDLSLPSAAVADKKRDAVDLNFDKMFAAPGAGVGAVDIADKVKDAGVKQLPVPEKSKGLEL